MLLAAPHPGMGTGLRSCVHTMLVCVPDCQGCCMTSLLCWAGVDSRGVASIYIASDSRISWGYTEQVFDQGHKAFACNQAPFIFGYWGDVLFPALVLPVIQEKVDRGFLAARPGTRAHDSIVHAIRTLWDGYPEHQKRDFGILIGSRSGSGMTARFLLTKLNYQGSSKVWSRLSVPMPLASAVLRYEGSGSDAVRKQHQIWDLSSAKGTSRAAFSGFCDSLNAAEDTKSGGPPQLVGIHRKGNAQSFGLIYNNRRFFGGARVFKNENSNSVAWFNGLFERVRPGGTSRIRGAQRHGRG